MAAQRHPHRSIAIGLSGGIGFVLPLAAYVATAPFDAAHDVVRVGGLPFAAGALASAGACAVALRLADRAADEEAVAAAQGDGCLEHGEAPGFDAETSFSRKSRTGIFARREQDDVPVIARAADAMSEAEAWAEIDSIMSDDSPVSCDPGESKDIYQIALEELARAARAQGDAATSSRAADAAAFIALRQANAPCSFASSSASDTACMSALDLDLDEPSGFIGVERQPVSVSVAPVAEAAPADDVAVAALPIIEVVDYSGHEEMWKQAFAVMEEEADAAYRPAHFKEVGCDRAEALAEGRRFRDEFSHVNEILGEEFGRVESQSVRHTSHEYLRVIEGGTQSMPRLTVEA